MKTRRELLGCCLAAAATLTVTGVRAEQMKMPTLASNLIDALRSIDKEVCIASANELQAVGDGESDIMLHLRNAGLDALDALILANAFAQPSKKQSPRIRSFSVSYNPLLANNGVVALAASLPLDISDIGFVGCKIGDEGGEALLEWAEKSTRLSMICVEGNSFSKNIKTEFQKLSDTRPGLLTVI